MNHKHSPYREALTTFPMVMALLLCCVTFIGCPEGTEMVEDVMQPTPPAVDTVEPPSDPVTPPEPVTPEPEPVAPLPTGTVVFVEPRQVASPTVGQQLTVNINIKDAADVLAYEATLGFDPTALRYVGSANADYLPAGAFEAPARTTQTSVTLTATSVSGPAAAASGTLAIVTFEVIAAKASTITLSDVLLSDSNVTPLVLKTADGKVQAP